MNMARECVTCILNQMLRVADHLDLPPQEADALFTAALKEASQRSFSQVTAPQYAQRIYARIAELTGSHDPYKNLKREQNDWVLAQSDRIKGLLDAAPDRLRLSAELALLGNVIDYGGVSLFDHRTLFDELNSLALSLDDTPLLARRLETAQTLLMIGDNAGEAVFDRFWLEEIRAAYPQIRLTYAVRKEPAINDMTLSDALEIGMDRVAELIDSGSNFAGTIPSLASAAFRQRYENADLVISKGQGNYETLEGCEREIFFVFKVKCQVVARYANLPLGSLVLATGSSLQKQRSHLS